MKTNLTLLPLVALLIFSSCEYYSYPNEEGGETIYAEDLKGKIAELKYEDKDDAKLDVKIINDQIDIVGWTNKKNFTVTHVHFGVSEKDYWKLKMRINYKISSNPTFGEQESIVTCYDKSGDPMVKATLKFYISTVGKAKVRNGSINLGIGFIVFLFALFFKGEGKFNKYLSIFFFVASGITILYNMYKIVEGLFF